MSTLTRRTVRTLAMACFQQRLHFERVKSEQGAPTDADHRPADKMGRRQHQPDELLIRGWVLPREVRGPGAGAVPGEGLRRRCPGQQVAKLRFSEWLLEEVSVMYRRARPRKELLRSATGGSRTHLVDIDVHASPAATAPIRSRSHERRTLERWRKLG